MVDYKLNAAAGTFAMVTGHATLSVHGPLPADHPFYASVGRVASEWAHLEHTLDLIIWELTGLHPKYAACITSYIMGVGSRCKAIIALSLAKGLEPPTFEPKAFRSLMNDSYAVADMRARIVHDPWYAEYNSQVPSQFRAMAYSDRRYGLHDVTDAEIDDTIDKIRKLNERAMALRTSVATALAALRGATG